MNLEAQQLFWSIAICVFLVLLLLAIIKWYGWKERRIEFLWANAIDHYVETGEKTKAFRSIPSSYLKATEDKRRNTVRQRVSERKVFETVCSCPSCNDLNLHYFKINETSDYIFANCTILRECHKCGFTWRETLDKLSENRH